MRAQSITSVRNVIYVLVVLISWKVLGNGTADRKIWVGIEKTYYSSSTSFKFTFECTAVFRLKKKVCVHVASARRQAPVRLTVGHTYNQDDRRHRRTELK